MYTQGAIMTIEAIKALIDQCKTHDSYWECEKLLKEKKKQVRNELIKCYENNPLLTLKPEETLGSPELDVAAVFHKLEEMSQDFKDKVERCRQDVEDLDRMMSEIHKLIESVQFEMGKIRWRVK